MGEFGKDLSRLALLFVGGTLRAEGDEIGCELRGSSSSFKSESELRLFFLGGPVVGMKLGCSPMVESPSEGFDVEPGEVRISSKPGVLRAPGPSLLVGRPLVVGHPFEAGRPLEPGRPLAVGRPFKLPPMSVD